MSFSTPRLLTLAFACFTIAIAAAPRARAATCGDTDCGKGFTCVTTSIPTPVSAPPAKEACPLDAPCAVTDPAVPAVDAGAPTTESFCVAASCTTDGDCGVGMICHTSTEACATSGSACAAGTKCTEPTPTPCEPTSVSTCAYKWQLACNVDTDCGDGFTCMPTVSGACSGGSAGGGTASSGGAATGSGGAASSEPNIAVPAADGGSAPHDMCTTTTSFPGYCQAKLVACTLASDCPAAWTCAAQAVGVGVATSGSTTLVDAGAPTNTTSNMAAIAPGEPAPTGTTPPTTMMVCTPPGGGYLSGGVTNGGGAPTETTTTGAAGTNGGGSKGTGGAHAGDTTGTPAAPTASGAGASSAGCALGGRPGPASLGLTALALLGLAAARRRR
ncbi:MAG TPA: hypothetical protein VK989_19150 [Polyangia bacterium]|jgi:hypothetical protein|nr:hypothetical protein [Polyangia bacterium]